MPLIWIDKDGVKKPAQVTRLGPGLAMDEDADGNPIISVGSGTTPGTGGGGTGGTTGCPLFCGTGSPEGVVAGPPGSIYEQTDAGIGVNPVWVRRGLARVALAAPWFVDTFKTDVGDTDINGRVPDGGGLGATTGTWRFISSPTTLGIDSDGLYPIANNLSGFYGVQGLQLPADYRVSVTIGTQSSLSFGNQAIYLFARNSIDSLTSGYRLFIVPSTELTQLTLYRDTTVLGQAQTATPTMGQDITLTLEVEGAHVRAYIGLTPVIDYLDATPLTAPGFAGLAYAEDTVPIETTVWTHDFESYPDTAALLAAWTESDPTGSATWTLDGAHVTSGTKAAKIVLAGPETFGDLFILTRSVSGLRPNATHKLYRNFYPLGDVVFGGILGQWNLQLASSLRVADGAGVVPDITIGIQALGTGTGNATWWIDDISLVEIGPGGATRIHRFEVAPVLSGMLVGGTQSTLVDFESGAGATAGPPDPAHTTAVVEGGEIGFANNIIVTTRDLESIQTTGGATVTAVITGANPGSLTAVDNGNGTYTLTYTPAAAGTDSIDIFLDSARISASPYSSIVVALRTLAAAQSTATISDGTAGLVTTIRIQGRDAAGAPVHRGGASGTLVVTGANATSEIATDNANGTYEITYIPIISGTDVLAVKLNGTSIASSPFSKVVAWTPSGTDGAVATITVPPALSVGQSVLDPTLGKRIFKLLDNAAGAGSRWSALNMDNTLLIAAQAGVAKVFDVSFSPTTVSVTNGRNLFGTISGQLPGATWSRADAAVMYFVSATTGVARLYQRDVAQGTDILLKDLGTDSTYQAYWTANGGSGGTYLSDLRMNLRQTRYCAQVHRASTGAALGLVVWDQTLDQVWNWAAPSGKTALEGYIDKIGDFAVQQYTDSSWQVWDLTAAAPQAVITTAAVQQSDVGAGRTWEWHGTGLSGFQLNPVKITRDQPYTAPLTGGKKNPHLLGHTSTVSTDGYVYGSLYAPLPLGGTWTKETGPSTGPGIPFGLWGFKDTSLFGSFFTTGTMKSVTTSSVDNVLATAKAHGMRIWITLTAGRGPQLGPDGRFNLALWKGLVDQFLGYNFKPWVDDGTIFGLMVVDEPACLSCWNGYGIPQATVDQMGAYIKSHWPYMKTSMRVSPSNNYFKNYNWTSYDYGWHQYVASQGPVATVAAKAIADAKALGVGLVVGLNITHGGDGSSGIRPSATALATDEGRFSMSADEVRRYTAALLADPYPSYFCSWEYPIQGEDPTFFFAADFQQALHDAADMCAAHGGGSTPGSVAWAQSYPPTTGDRLVPQIVRMGKKQLTHVLTFPTKAGEWNHATGTLRVLNPSDQDPNTNDMRVLDLRTPWEEILRVKEDGTGLQRLCHHFSYTTEQDVGSQPRAAASYDGKYVAFTSNWGGGSTTGLYVVAT